MCSFIVYVCDFENRNTQVIIPETKKPGKYKPKLLLMSSLCVMINIMEKHEVEVVCLFRAMHVLEIPVRCSLHLTSL